MFSNGVFKNNYNCLSDVKLSHKQINYCDLSSIFLPCQVGPSIGRNLLSYVYSTWNISLSWHTGNTQVYSLTQIKILCQLSVQVLVPIPRLHYSENNKCIKYIFIRTATLNVINSQSQPWRSFLTDSNTYPFP